MGGAPRRDDGRGSAGSEARDGFGDGLCSDGAPDCIPPRASRGRRSGVVVPGGGQDTDTILLESVKAAPRRSTTAH
uniref:Uncharacterized protein n=1 Tax=Neogobius melanostomus TaxID=47308 RepID=A0A8C6TG31_9GOBI